ncbi:mannitol dehydrogenase family protein [Algibacter miyuki]|uniref:Mannitol dehydrogenase family protein n=1 Tax=Algibacter miyuki TaxID=1306933 RepID=A0ABV5H3E5_9FLAO|nr:mannitol dehydrogenase family protein [Algibacter miyuki]MDN3666598.1 mannitol dehydrogenase family protein [Algibacter miyuki]
MENLDTLKEHVSIPLFDRDQITTSIAHIGVSNFHRAHQAFYINELIEKHNVLNSGICGIDLLDSDRKTYNVLKDQDGLYTLITKDASGLHKPQIIGSIVEYFFGPENPMAVIERLAHPGIKIISLTIAEDGYHLNETTGEFNQKHPAVAEEVTNPFNPKTVFGYLTQAFKLRKLRGLTGCTILSCDNIKNNGETMQHSFFNYVSKNEPELLPWLKQNTRFPNTMVDRITPVTQHKDIDALKKEFLVEDQWPVVCEPFASWVIEDDFFEAKPFWEKVGVQFVKDIEPYQNMKLQLLNAGHSVLGILGTLHGYKTVHEAANDDDFILFLTSFIEKEVSPTLVDAENISIETYKTTLISRFKNPNINDSLSRICSESSAKIPIFILSTLDSQLQNNKDINHIAFIIAAWCKYNDGIDDQGNTYDIIDSISNTLIRMAARSLQNPTKFLEIESVFKTLRTHTFFTEKYLKYLSYLRSHHIKESIIAFNGNKI